MPTPALTSTATATSVTSTSAVGKHITYIFSKGIFVAVTFLFQEKTSWCWNEQVCQGTESVKRSEWSNGLDTALYKDIPFLQFIPLTCIIVLFLLIILWFVIHNITKIAENQAVHVLPENSFLEQGKSRLCEANADPV